MSNKYILMFGVLRVRILSFSWRGSLVSYIVWGRNGVFPRYCPVYIPGIYLNKTGLNEHISVLHFEPDDRRGTQVVKLIRTSQFVWRKYCCLVGFSWYNGLYLQLFPIYVTIKHFSPTKLLKYSQEFKEQPLQQNQSLWVIRLVLFILSWKLILLCYWPD